MKFIRTTSKGYRWDSRIFLVSLTLVAIFAIYIMARHNFEFGLRPYVQCKGYAPCINPIYWAEEGKVCSDEKGVYCTPNPDLKKVKCSEPWCSQVWLNPGEYGQPKDPLFKVYLWTTIILFLLAIPANHFIHNRGKKIHLALEEYYEAQFPKIIKFLRKKRDELEE